MTNRRGFLGALGGLFGAAVLDPEKLLWVPGQKLISVPKLYTTHVLVTTYYKRQALDILAQKVVFNKYELGWTFYDKGWVKSAATLHTRTSI